jgi:hypothetical protein
MLNAYLLDNTPGVVLADDVSATKVDVLRRLTVAEPSTSGRDVVDHADISETSAEHTGVDLSEENSIIRDVGADVLRLPGGQEESGATTAH